VREKGDGWPCKSVDESENKEASVALTIEAY
jgi:hypothetical protein